MANNILWSSEESVRLNKKIQDNIAKHLFLTCNYEIGPLQQVISEDAKYLTAVLNLYKFLIDSSIINKLDSLRKGHSEIHYEHRKLRKIIDIAKAVRTACAHNESEESGNDYDLAVYSDWVKSVIGKTEISTFAQYEKLRFELEARANEAVRIVNDFIDSAQKASDRSSLIKEWENLILRFYSTGNSDNIVKGQLKRAYKALWVTGGHAPRDITSRDVAEWIKKMYYCDEQKEIDKFQNIIELSRKTPLSSKGLVQIQAKIAENENKIKAKKSAIKKEIGADIDNNVYLYLDYYIKKFPGKLSEAVEKKNADEYGTLLPQDIVQYMINEDFAGVSIE